MWYHHPQTQEFASTKPKAHLNDCNRKLEPTLFAATRTQQQERPRQTPGGGSPVTRYGYAKLVPKRVDTV